ncbi:MAG: glycosyltransferase family protein [Pseudomonadales bacterium]|nr:glycosyltransferase family protein [Pseudomonadales bacterium]
MKILYGVQGTGNGHVSRCCAMAEALKAYPDIEIDWLLSSREKARGCGDIKEFLWRQGLTFVVKAGKVQLLGTLKKNNFLQFRRDVDNLDLRPYDLVISDYEPVLSHAARKRGIAVTGISHQYAFCFDIPMQGANPLVRTIMKHYAPVTLPVGLHWHHFNVPVLPPILDIVVPAQLPKPLAEKVLVYLPFESPALILELLRDLSDFDFYVYHPDMTNRDCGHIHTRAISRTGFKKDLLDAGQVIANSGFELTSECLQIGKCILSRPLSGQMEQLSNAQALRQLGYATVLEQLEKRAVASWLRSSKTPVRVSYPDVAARLARWLADGCPESVEMLADALWQAPAAS